MDIYFTSPLLFPCLLAKLSFCIGNEQKNKVGQWREYEEWALGRDGVHPFDGLQGNATSLNGNHF